MAEGVEPGTCGDDTRCHTCRSCGNRLVPSRNWLGGNSIGDWMRPWGPVIKMATPVEPWACLNCGEVFMFLRDLARVKREMEKLSDKERKDAELPDDC